MTNEEQILNDAKERHGLSFPKEPEMIITLLALIRYSYLRGYNEGYKDQRADENNLHQSH